MSATANKTFSPATDIYESEDAFHIYLDMPGIVKENVDIKFEKGVLSIQGESNLSKPEGKQCLLHEFDAGSYKRAFTVSEEVEEEEITATMKEGILHIVLPKSKKVRAKQIEVK